MANKYPAGASQGPDSQVGAGTPNFYVAPRPTVPVDPANQNSSRDPSLGVDALQGVPVSAPAFVPGSFHFSYSPNDLGGVEMTLIRDSDQSQEDGLGFRTGAA
jgi:hypothetical protein